MPLASACHVHALMRHLLVHQIGGKEKQKKEEDKQEDKKLPCHLLVRAMSTLSCATCQLIL